MKKIKKFLTITIIIFQILLTQGCTKQTTNWKQIEPGIEKLTLNTTKNKITIIKINPQKYTFQIYENKNKKTAKTIKEINQETNSIITLNGNFFTPDFKSTGLLISNGKILHPLIHSKLTNAIAAIDKNNNYKIIHITKTTPTKKMLKNYTFAIQNGPLLIDEKGTIQVKPTNKKASRTIIAKDKNNNILLIFIKQNILDLNNKITLYNIATLLKKDPILKPLKITSALNLDGGTSTGFIIKDEYNPEIIKIQNAITIKPKK